ncbi:hypothetical protein EVJ58_g5021 [Rhodofomes roseus]|uniref:F-box domain-containing protein n=1 Tax=Rhodofomes roseus TaxID=34475 RepID=A0A4Y9YDM1_9APHY|nr:hypothetical protein EVJ58_g5021 [Rhodofomes roseus]
MSDRCAAKLSPEPSTPGIREPLVTVNDLPADVLLLVFCAVRDTESHCTPWALASVCHTWRELVENVSSFWTRLVIWVDEPNGPLPLARIRKHLACSRELPIDIFISRRREWQPPMGTDHEEKARVKAIMDVLAPHMKRWRSLLLRLLHSDSLPLPRIDLVGHADKLKILSLDSIIDDSAASDEAASPITGEFHTPELTELFMKGVHFREVYVKPCLQMSQFPPPPTLQSICISKYESHHPPFPLVDLLLCLLHCVMTHLRLADLALDCSYTGPPILETTYTRLGSVAFFDITGNVLAEFHRLLSHPVFAKVSYTRCSKDDNAILGASYSLDIEGITDAMTLLKLLLSAVRSPHLCCEVSFKDCDGLSSEVMKPLSRPFATPHGEQWPACPYIKALTFQGCKRFHSSALRSLLQARYDAHAASGSVGEDEPGFMVSAVKELYVTDCCELAQEDLEWFDRHVAVVRWDDWTGGYDRRS